MRATYVCPGDSGGCDFSWVNSINFQAYICRYAQWANFQLFLICTMRSKKFVNTNSDVEGFRGQPLAPKSRGFCRNAFSALWSRFTNSCRTRLEASGSARLAKDRPCPPVCCQQLHLTFCCYHNKSHGHALVTWCVAMYA